MIRSRMMLACLISVAFPLLACSDAMGPGPASADLALSLNSVAISGTLTIESGPTSGPRPLGLEEVEFTVRSTIDPAALVELKVIDQAGNCNNHMRDLSQNPRLIDPGHGVKYRIEVDNFHAPCTFVATAVDTDTGISSPGWGWAVPGKH